MIAARAGIRHPEADGWPNVIMTSDFTYCKGGVWYAVAACFSSSELSNTRVAEKLKIERLYWEEKHIRWSVMTEKDISRTRARNILWITEDGLSKIWFLQGIVAGLSKKCFQKSSSDPGIPFGVLIREMEQTLKLKTEPLSRCSNTWCGGRILLILTGRSASMIHAGTSWE